MNHTGWYGVDLDGTLAKYDSFISPLHIGEPVPAMVERVKFWLEEGKDVRIMTARAASLPDDKVPVQDCIRAVEAWCLKHLGKILPVTATKDYQMVQLWDDRAVQVIPNTGFPLTAGGPFICGHAGPQDSMGLPDKLFVCPTFGLDGFAVYTKSRDYDAPGY